MTRANTDLGNALAAWRIWIGLGWQDIQIRYQRTLLGPWWVTMGQMVTFIVMGMLFSAVLRTDVRQYMPYLSISIVTWNLFASIILESPLIFIDAKHLILSVRMPLLVHVLRSIVRQFLVFLHNFLAVVVVCLYFEQPVNESWFLLPLSVFLLLGIALPCSVALAILGARFRDAQPILGIATQVLFFLTPIVWRWQDLPLASKWWVTINPLHHMLELVRAPLLGSWPDSDSLFIVFLMMILLNLWAWGIFILFRSRVPYWI